MNKVFAILISAVAVLVLAAAPGAPRAAAPSGPAVASAEPLLTAWRCPITDKFFASPLTCRNNCFGVTCVPVTQ